MSSVPAPSLSNLWSNTIQPALKPCLFIYSSYSSIAKSPVFNWSSKFENPQAIRMQRALTLLFAACIGLCTAKVQKAASNYLESQNFKRKFVVQILVGAAIGGLSGIISSSLIPFCQKVQTLVESNLYPVFGWKVPTHRSNFLPFPYNLTVRPTRNDRRPTSETP